MTSITSSWTHPQYVLFFQLSLCVDLSHANYNKQKHSTTAKIKCGQVSLPPVVSEPSVCSDFLHPLEILTEFVFQLVGKDLRVLAITMIFLSIEEPIWNLILTRVLHNSNHSVNLERGKC